MGLALSLCLAAVVGCNGPAPTERALTADVPLHLEEYLALAQIEGSEVPKDLPERLEWRFAKDIKGWKAIVPFKPGIKPLQVSHQNDALRLTLTKENRNTWGFRLGVAYVDLPDLNREDWGFIVIGARTKDDITWISPYFNLLDKRDDGPGRQGTFVEGGDTTNVINDGEVHTYLIGTEGSWGNEPWKGPWKQLGIAVGSNDKELDDSRKGPISIDIVSVSVIPKEAAYAKLRAGTSWESWGEAGRRVLYTHVPGKLEYDVAIPKKGRLDVGLGLLKKNIPVNFKISARERGAASGPRTLLEETCLGEEPRVQRSLDLSSLSGKTVTLALETEAERPGNIAFWANPTLSSPRATALPNIIFYVIDGAAAESMSVYDYNRRTTPHLERLAAEGAVFENAYSNSAWTWFSVPSFMTSLHNSVLGRNRKKFDPLPEQAVTMAERMHKAGYLTEVLTSNPYCGRLSSLDRGVDFMIDTEPEAERDKDPLAASAALHRHFWEFRDAYPGEPYWVHFQPTDVHRPWRPVAPFTGLFATLEEHRIFNEMTKKMEGLQFQNFTDRIEKAGVDRTLYSQISRKVYDESMAHQDYTIGRLVARLKDRGEWGNTLFIVAADHSSEAAGLPLLDPKGPNYPAPLLASQKSHIPMIFVWPGKIPPGRRLSQPVSMIDMLPTILDLAGLPGLEITQGQSLAPLLLGKPGWTHRPIVFDEFDITGNYFFGSIEVIDGRWGASLSIDNRPDDKKTPWDRARPAPLLIFDVWEDPHAFRSLHEERPDLVEKYSKMLNGIYKEHEALAKKFSRAASVPLTPEQIETLRSLGYLR